jgi:hypothetical protein
MSPERIDKKDHYTGENKCPGQFIPSLVCLYPNCKSKDQPQDNPFDMSFHRIFSVSSQRNNPFAKLHWRLFITANLPINQQRFITVDGFKK